MPLPIGERVAIFRAALALHLPGKAWTGKVRPRAAGRRDGLLFRRSLYIFHCLLFRVCNKTAHALRPGPLYILLRFALALSLPAAGLVANQILILMWSLATRTWRRNLISVLTLQQPCDNRQLTLECPTGRENWTREKRTLNYSNPSQHTQQIGLRIFNLHIEIILLVANK